MLRKVISHSVTFRQAQGCKILDFGYFKTYKNISKGDEKGSDLGSGFLGKSTNNVDKTTPINILNRLVIYLSIVTMK